MEENRIGKFLRIVAIIEAISGFLLGFIMLAEDGDLFPFAIGIIIVGLVNSLMFFGFGEIINLLQKSVNKQDEMLSYMKDKLAHDTSAPKTLLEDIESNLPEM